MLENILSLHHFSLCTYLHSVHLRHPTFWAEADNHGAKVIGLYEGGEVSLYSDTHIQQNCINVTLTHIHKHTYLEIQHIEKIKNDSSLSPIVRFMPSASSWAQQST